ncbi:MAG: sensor domain-containing diguanylate cyclase [Polynucleobacter sp.]|nr:sensor domain-containing diguanylate cyclase [Polynucleobacter sp.]
MLTGGVRAPVIIAFPVLIIMIGWVIGSRAALITSVMTALVISSFVVADARGSLPGAPPDLPVLHGIVQVIVLILSTTLVVVLARSYQNRLRDMDALGKDLARHSAELEVSKADLHRAQAVAKVGSWVFDLAADTMRLSAEACRIFGLPEGTRGSRDSYLARVHPDDRDEVARVWQATLEGGPAFDHEHRILVGGTVRWVRQEAELEFAADGTPQRAVGITQDITECKAAEEEINNLAYYDPLTQLPNRRLLMDRMNHAIATCLRSKRGGALFFVDLDNFKILNDTCGHHIGDLLLLQVAERLGTCVREVDTVARLGGDEFVVVLTDLSEESEEAAAQAKAVGEKVLAILGQAYLLAGRAHQSTASIGITLFGRQPVTVNDLLKQADIAMYQAKAAGRNTLSFFGPKPSGANPESGTQNHPAGGQIPD